MSDKCRVLVVAAHPDDEILGMGGTIAKHVREGVEVAILWVSEGSSTQYPGDTDIMERKFREAKDAAKTLGVTRCLQRGMPDMRLDTLPHVDVNRVVEDAVDELAPHTVYTVHPDVNMDHRTVFHSVLVATRPRPGSPVRRVLSYATTSGIEWAAPFDDSFRPTWFVNITDTVEEKVAAFDCYTTEMREWPHPRSPHAIRVTAQSWGTWVGAECAEPFMLIRQVCD